MPALDWTAILALATVLLALDGPHGVGKRGRLGSRRSGVRELVFRGTLVEFTTDIQSLETWDPRMGVGSPAHAPRGGSAI